MVTVTPDDIAVTLGRPSPAPGTPQFAAWSMWIADAELAIRIGLTQRRIDGGLDGLDPEVLAYVIRQAVALKVQQPADGASQVDVAVDDARISRRYGANSTSVAILPQWWAMLLPDGDGQQEAYNIDTAARAGSSHVPWCNLAFGASWCSCGADLAGFPLYEDAP